MSWYDIITHTQHAIPLHTAGMTHYHKEEVCHTIANNWYTIPSHMAGMPYHRIQPVCHTIVYSRYDTLSHIWGMPYHCKKLVCHTIANSWYAIPSHTASMTHYHIEDICHTIANSWYAIPSDTAGMQYYPIQLVCHYNHVPLGDIRIIQQTPQVITALCQWLYPKSINFTILLLVLSSALSQLTCLRSWAEDSSNRDSNSTGLPEGWESWVSPCE
jgi:hypothetical protein